MAKSIKKAIACMLTVLMVVCSMPLTAFAVVGEVETNVKLLFNPVYTGAYFEYSEVQDGYFDTTMLQEAPLTYNYKYNEVTGGVSGTLVLEAKKTIPVCESLGLDPLAEDTTLGVGDFFSVTVVMENCPSIQASQQWIQYSDNIEPAGLYTRTAQRKNYQTLVGMSDTNFDKISQGGLVAIDSNSAAGLYPGLDDGELGNLSKVDPTTRTIKSNNSNQNPSVNQIDTSKVNPGDAVYTNPETGELNYTFDNVAVTNTFIFKIVGDGEISFQLDDPKNEKGGYNTAYLLDTKSNGFNNNQYTTYATTWPEGTAEVHQAVLGAGKMTFFGGNINTGVVPTPDEPVEQPHVHHYTPVVTAPTCTEQGYTTYTCDNADGKCDNISYVADYVDATGHTPAAAVVENNVAATCTEKGTYDEVVYCSVCNTEISRTQKENAALGHDMQVVEGTAKAATCAVAGKEADKACSRCDYTEEGAVIPATGAHTEAAPVRENEVPATCVDDGSYDEVVYCSVCGTELSRVSKTIPCVGAHDYSVPVEGTAKAATCTEPGKEADMKCSACDAIQTGAVINALGHDMQVVEGTAKAATCVEAGKEADKACSRCDYKEAGAVIPATGIHTPVSANNAVAPTPAKDGHEADTICDVCGATLENGAVIPALGINVTIDGAHKSYGTVNMAWGVNNVKYGSTVTVTAAPLEDCDFVGYEVAGKLVSKDPTYTYVAYKDITITPVFVPHAEDKITVLFYDKYSNVVANYTDVTVEEFQAAMAASIPTAPTYAGYTFTGWSLTEDQIKALDQSTTIWAYYAQVKDELFTVKTTADSTLTVTRGTEVTPTEYKVTFDTKATVYNENATAWSVDGTIVGYGDTYEFYVGSDIFVEPVFAAVDAKATVTMIKNYLIQEGSHKVMFLASMSVPDGYTLVDHGFVYGKNLADADMTLENVGNAGSLAGAGTVKVTSAGTSPVEQFGISYGIKAKTGKACAKAFLTYVKDGELHTIYSDATEYVY